MEQLINISTETKRIIKDSLKEDCIKALKYKHQLGLMKIQPYYNKNHNRYKHSLEATEVLHTIINHIGNVSDEIKYLTLNSILYHDVGHLPYCHTMEHAFIKNNICFEDGREFKHETMTCNIIDSLNLFEDKEKYIMKHLIDGKYKHIIRCSNYNNPVDYTSEEKFILSLISNKEIDVDRIQYLMMDSFFLKHPDPKINLEDLIRNITISNGKYLFNKSYVKTFLAFRKSMYEDYYLKLDNHFNLIEEDFNTYKNIINDINKFNFFYDKHFYYCERRQAFSINL